MGKTYVCSDIHGMGGTYLDTLKKLNKDDVLYILGDATDRGDEGIGILYDIMKHNGENSQKPQIKYILGNHDLMLIENMETIMKYNIKIKDIQRYSNLIKMCNELYDKRVWGEGSGREHDSDEDRDTKDSVGDDPVDPVCCGHLCLALLHACRDYLLDVLIARIGND